ncbi:MAG: hypothetical protein ACXAC8_13000 [Candidatus Hodarchaeales archaeon]
MKKHRILSSFLGTLLLILPMIILVTCIDQNSLGITVGYTFNVEVIENPRDSIPNRDSGDRQSPKGSVPPEGGFELENFILYPIIDTIPTTGTIFSIEVLTIPNGTTLGKLSASVRGSVTEYYTDFSYGSPVLFNDWDGWVYVLNNLEETTSESNENIESVVVDITTNSATTFQSEITFTFSIPEERQENIQERSITQQVRYNKATGIQESMVVESQTTTSLMGERIQRINMKFTTKSATPPPSPDYSTLIILVGGGSLIILIAGVIIMNRSRYETQSIRKDMRTFQKKTTVKEKTQLRDIRTKIAEIEKLDRKSLEKAEAALKNKKILKRRRY